MYGIPAYFGTDDLGSVLCDLYAKPHPERLSKVARISAVGD